MYDLPHKLPNDLPLRLKILGNPKTSYNYILPIAQSVPLPKQKFREYWQKYAERWKLNFSALFHIKTREGLPQIFYEWLYLLKLLVYQSLK